jgi:hypothetical protein
MKHLKILQIPLLALCTLSLTSCTDVVSVEEVSNGKVNASKEIANELVETALSPIGATVTLENIEAFSILIPEQATEQETYSATMLADYLGKMFSTTLPVIQEPQGVAGKMISVGYTAAAAAANITGDPREQAYKLAVDDGNLYILGGTRGPIYGVIALLEEDLGCRWYSARNDVAPVIPTRAKDRFMVVPRSYSPPFELRDVFYWNAFSLSANWAVFNRIQAFGRYNEMTLETGGGLSNSKYWVHTYHNLVPADRYFAQHPEYFPLRDGKRHPSTISDGQLCYTSLGVVEVMVKKLDAEIVNKPGSRIYSVSSNDNVHDNCECAPCQKIIKSDGVPGAQLYLANAVAAKLAVKYPQIKITTLAYVNSQKPPKNIKPGPNTVILYAPIRQRFNPASMLLPIGEIEEIRNELAAWNKIASHIYLWDYTDIISKTPVPFPNFDAQNRAWDFLIENGVTGVFMQGTFVMHGSLGELKSWLYAKKLWNPSWDQEALINEFVSAYYGPAAVEMAEYVALQRQAWANFYRDRKPGTVLKFSPTEIDRMYELLDAAMIKYSGRPDDEIKIERERLTLLCLSLSAHPSKETAADYADKLKEAEALINKFEIVKFGEGTTAAANLRAWNKKLKRATDGNPLPQYSRNSVTVKEPVCAAGARYLPDADATLGLASRQPGGNGEWGVQFPFEDFLDLLKPEQVYIVRMRVRAEFKGDIPQEIGHLFTLGAYTYGGVGPGSQGPALTGNFSANDKGDYRWVELGKLQINTPNAAGLLYCFPGKGLTKDDAVWYDYIEFVPENEFKDTKLANTLALIKI